MTDLWDFRIFVEIDFDLMLARGGAPPRQPDHPAKARAAKAALVSLADHQT